MRTMWKMCDTERRVARADFRITVICCASSVAATATDTFGFTNVRVHSKELYQPSHRRGNKTGCPYRYGVFTIPGFISAPITRRRILLLKRLNERRRRCRHRDAMQLDVSSSPWPKFCFALMQKNRRHSLWEILLQALYRALLLRLRKNSVRHRVTRDLSLAEIRGSLRESQPITGLISGAFAIFSLEFLGMSYTSVITVDRYTGCGNNYRHVEHL